VPLHLRGRLPLSGRFITQPLELMDLTRQVPPMVADPDSSHIRYHLTLSLVAYLGCAALTASCRPTKRVSVDVSYTCPSTTREAAHEEAMVRRGLVGIRVSPSRASMTPDAGRIFFPLSGQATPALTLADSDESHPSV
jgi:hypothetical protein